MKMLLLLLLVIPCWAGSPCQEVCCLEKEMHCLRLEYQNLLLRASNAWEEAERIQYDDILYGRVVFQRAEWYCRRAKEANRRYRSLKLFRDALVAGQCEDGQSDW